MSRACRRPGCDRPAVARLSYDAVTCQVWLDTMPERAGSAQEICSMHVDRLTVPRGWMLCDRRVEEPAMFLTEPTPLPPRPPRHPSVPPSPVLVDEPELFAPPPTGPVGGPEAHEAPAAEGELDVVELSVVGEEAVVIEEAAVVDEPAAASEHDSGHDAGDDSLLRPRSPLLARAFRAAGSQPAVLTSGVGVGRPGPDRADDRDRSDDEGAAR